MSRRKRTTREQEIMRKMCLGKIKHKSRLAAQYYIDHIPHRDKSTLNMYDCPFCKGIHIGHNKDLDPMKKEKS